MSNKSVDGKILFKLATIHAKISPSCQLSVPKPNHWFNNFRSAYFTSTTGYMQVILQWDRYYEYIHAKQFLLSNGILVKNIYFCRRHNAHWIRTSGSGSPVRTPSKMPRTNLGECKQARPSDCPPWRPEEKILYMLVPKLSTHSTIQLVSTQGKEGLIVIGDSEALQIVFCDLLK